MIKEQGIANSHISCMTHLEYFGDTILRKNQKCKLSDKNWDCCEVVFGFINIQLEETPQDSANSSNQDERIEEIERQGNACRQKIKAALSKCGDLTEIDDLFDSNERKDPYVRFCLEEVLFHPLVAMLQLPAYLNKEFDSGIMSEVAAKQYAIVTDGSILLLAVPSISGRVATNFPDVRDYVLQVFERSIEFEIVPPNVSRSSVMIVNGMAAKQPFESDCTPFELRKRTNLCDALNLLYLSLIPGLTEYYDLCLNTHECQSDSIKVLSEERELLRLVRQFVETRIYEIVKRRTISKKVRQKIATILELLSDQRLTSRQTSDDEESFRQYLNEDEVVEELLTKMDWKDYVEPEKFVDYDSAMAIVDHVRSEMQTSNLVSISVWAAVIGAIIGSLATLLITKFP